MIEAVSGIAGAIGLSTSAGLNAYLPLLVVGLVARYTDLIRLNGPWDVLTSGWAIAVLGVLLLIEMTVDKIPAVDTLNDGIQTIGRPLAGAILFAAGSGMVGELHPVLAFIAGLLIAGGVHAAKTVARPAVTATTGGMGNWLVSLVEDVLSFIIAIVAILVPLLVLLVIAVVLLLYVRVTGKSNAET
ncbi:MAG: DUF4126 domain-containing protein [Methanoregulaceae archaeon]|nr:MAG: DUF4126 domain-containing protein [Methanoregulaceae archaeon]